MRSTAELIGTGKGLTAVIVCTGPSVYDIDLHEMEKYSGWIIIAINDAIFHLEAPHYHLFGDDIAARYLPGALERISLNWKPQGEEICSRPKDWTYPEQTCIVTQKKAAKRMELIVPEDRIYVFRPTPLKRLQTLPDTLYWKNTTLDLSVSLAWRLNVDRVYLLGADAYMRSNKRYFYHKGFDPSAPIKGDLLGFCEGQNELAAWFDSVGWGRDRVINLSPKSNHGAWAKEDPANALTFSDAPTQSTDEPDKCGTCAHLLTLDGYHGVPVCGLDHDVTDFRDLPWAYDPDGNCRFWKERR